MMVSMTIMLVGLLIVASPVLSAKVAGISMGLFALYYLLKRVAEDAISNQTYFIKKWKLYIHVALIMLVVTLLNQIELIVQFTQLILSLSFLCLAYRQTVLFFSSKKKGWMKWINGMIAIVTFLFGIIPVTSFALDISMYTMTAGTFILIYGTILTIKNIKEEQETLKK